MNYRILILLIQSMNIQKIPQMIQILIIVICHYKIMFKYNHQKLIFLATKNKKTHRKRRAKRKTIKTNLNTKILFIFFLSLKICMHIQKEKT